MKCENDKTPCKRCIRLSLECIPHVSRQGQGPKRRYKKARARSEQFNEESLEAEVVEHTSKLGANHYGLFFVVRHWVSFAFSRRSFSLLARATSLACRCGITMDQILCGINDFPTSATSIDGSRMMSFLPDMILKPSNEQQVGGRPLLLSEVPIAMLQAIDCRPDTLRDPEARWICIRELRCGASRYYVSRAMQRDMASWEKVQETWNANKMEVNDLWLPKEEKPKFTRGFNQQIAIHKGPHTQPKPTSIKGIKIRLGRERVVEVDCIMCLNVVNLDHAFLSTEYYVNETPEAASKDQSDADPFGDFAFLDSMMDELEATGELDDLLQGFEGF